MYIFTFILISICYMKTKDLVYIGIIGYLAYLLLKKKQTPTAETNATTSVPVGNSTNGGLNLGTNMDLPNLTPTSPNGLPTEDALGVSNVTPLVKDENEPTQIFGGVSLPPPYLGSSVISPTPLDVVPVSETANINAPISNTQPIANQINQMPVSTGIYNIQEPNFPIKTVTAQLTTNQPILTEPIPSKQLVNQIISECGNSFSFPNKDREGSYTNYWVVGDTFYTQTTSPLIKTIPTKISKELFIEACKKFQLMKMQKN